MIEVHKTSATALLKRLGSFDWAAWNKSLGKDLLQPYRDLVLTTAVGTAKALGVPLDVKDPMLSRFMTKYVMERATQLDSTTKADVANLIRSKFEDGTQPDDLNKAITAAVREKFEGYESWRANRIGRSESAIGYNHANVLGFSQAGVSEVEVVDGTDDDICEEANGQTYSLREALSDPIGHPNCTRSFIPIVPEGNEEEELRAFERLMLDDDLPGFCAAVAEFITSLDDPCVNRVLDSIDED